MEPLVSCIMPTRDRRPFVGRAAAQFLEQDHPNRELVVADDGHDGIADLLPADASIRLLRPDRRLSTGAKRNLACEASKGELASSLPVHGSRRWRYTPAWSRRACLT